MKSTVKYIWLLLLTVFVCLCNGQDIITLKNGNEIKTKVIEIESDAIKYKKFDNINGPTYSFTKSEVFMIHYENGTKEIITSAAPPAAQTALTTQPNNQPVTHQNYVTGENSKYKKEIVGGAVMTALGIPLTITGATLTAIGGIINQSAVSFDDYDGNDLWITGAVLLVSGTALTIAGPIQLSKGIKHRREVKRGRAFIDFKPISNIYLDMHFHTGNYQTVGAISIHF